MASNEGATLAELISEPAAAPELALLPQQLPPATPGGDGKRRGRPLGSRNRPKPPVVIVRESQAAMRPVLLELAAGCDVAGALADFGRRRGVGVTVLCGRGAVSAITLRLSTSPAASSAVTLEGRLDVLSLSGTVLPSSNAGVEGDVPPPPFSVALAGGGGQVIGGTLAGVMTAAEGGMVVVAATFGNAEVHRLPAQDAGEGMDNDGRGGRQEEVPPPPPLPQLQAKQNQAMVGTSAAADVGYVAAHGGASGWGGGYPGQVGHYQQQHAEHEQMIPWGHQFPPDLGAPSHPSNYNYL
uniref:Uncharacterized protein n=1 Tax=Avena sativa TaxID=4498 RepID=A0ACD5WKD6_AVESA